MAVKCCITKWNIIAIWSPVSVAIEVWWNSFINLDFKAAWPMFTYIKQVSYSAISNKHKTQPHSLLEFNKMASYGSRWRRGMEYNIFQSRAARYIGVY
jgi:hypothetical protein